MEVVYIDLLFLINLAADYLICLAAARVCGVRLRRRRYLLSAVTGALYAVAVFLPGLGFLASPIFKAACAAVMCAVSYGCEEKPLRCSAVFLTVSAAFGGAVWALSMARGGSPTVSPRVLFLSFSLCYAALTIVFRRRAGLMERRRVLVTVEFMGRLAEFIALSDSGNSLADPVSGEDVMIVCPHALKGVFLDNTVIFTVGSAVETVELADALPELKGRFRLLPYSALGGGGLLPVFKPGRVTVDGAEKRSLLVAVSPDAAGDGFEAIL